MCRSVAWGREPRRAAPVLVVARHPLLGGTLELPLADLASRVRLLSPTPRARRRREWALALGGSRRRLCLRAASDAQFEQWTRLTRRWLRLGHELAAAVVTASASTSATSGKRRAQAGAAVEPARIDLTPVPWTPDVPPSTPQAAADPPEPALALERGSSRADRDPTDGDAESDRERNQPSRSVFSLLQALEAQDASLETMSSARASSADAMSIAPLSQATDTWDAELTSRDTTASSAAFSIGDSAARSSSMSATAREWTHPTGRKLSSVSLSSWLSESDLEDPRASSFSLPQQHQHGRRRASSEDGRASSFDYEEAFPWIFDNAAERRVVVITRPRIDADGNQAVYFF